MKSSSKNASSSAPSKTGRAATENKKILLVEDEPEMRDLLSQMLLSEGYEVLAIANGEEAMQEAVKENVGEIHLLVSDLVMPKVGGLQLAVWFRNNFPKAKILIISGYTNEMVIFEQNLSSKTSFLPKPLRAPAFKAKVAELLKEE